MKWIVSIIGLVVITGILIILDEKLLNIHFRVKTFRRRNEICKLSSKQINEQLVNSTILIEDVFEESCDKIQNIVFLKTHKTGSSTITSILNRYADLYDLTMCLPAKQLNRFYYPAKFQARFIDEKFLQYDKKSNILANHVRMNKREIEKVMQPNSKYITILRNPVTLFESAFYYLEIHKQLRLTNYSDPLSVYLNDTVKYYRILEKIHNSNTFGLIRNGMLFDLGFVSTPMSTSREIDKAVQKVEEEFDLVLITEYFDESLVLLMRKFCWTFDDILYLKQNERAKKRKKISNENAELIKKWNEGDYKLYQTFNKTFWRTIQEEGPSFWEDLEEFKKRKGTIIKQCGFVQYTKHTQNSNVDIHDFKLLYNNPLMIPFCKKLLTGEIDYVKYFRAKYERSKEAMVRNRKIVVQMK